MALKNGEKGALRVYNTETFDFAVWLEWKEKTLEEFVDIINFMYKNGKTREEVHEWRMKNNHI